MTKTTTTILALTLAACGGSSGDSEPACSVPDGAYEETSRVTYSDCEPVSGDATIVASFIDGTLTLDYPAGCYDVLPDDYDLAQCTWDWIVECQDLTDPYGYYFRTTGHGTLLQGGHYEGESTTLYGDDYGPICTEAFAYTGTKL